MNFKYKNLAIIYSEVPNEGRNEDDSALSTVEAFENCLKEFNVQRITIPYPCSSANILEIMSELKSKNIDFVFNFCEEVNGDSYYEAHIASMLELLNIPFSGSSSETLSFCRNKFRVNSFLKNLDIKVPNPELITDIDQIKSFTGKKIIKPCTEDGSLGINKENVCSSIEEVKKVYNSLKEFIKGDLLIEDYIDGREINVSILDGIAFGFSEILYEYKDLTHPNILTYESKWDVKSDNYNSSKVICPSNIDEKLKEKIKEISERVYKVLKIRHLARIDFRVNDDLIYLIDVNPNPCISPDSGFMKALNNIEKNYKKIIEIFFSI